jgi:hypothetical protein
MRRRSLTVWPHDVPVGIGEWRLLGKSIVESERALQPTDNENNGPHTSPNGHLLLVLLLISSSSSFF